VGRCEATLDQRDLDPAVLAAMFREAREASERFAREERCTVEWSRIWQIEPIAFHPKMLDLCDEAVREVAGVSHRMPSGPLHDAAEVSRAGIPTVMMFVQSLGGISHNKVEDTREEHLELAVRAFDRLASKAIANVGGGSL
jgi:acetylornithine deacetylase/succinyl-diaminopimelate desuccinylase-like protein